MGEVLLRYVEHGQGRPVLVLHGAGVDHRESEACFEPAFERLVGYRRVYPDLPGMGKSSAPASLRSADDVLETLLDFADDVFGSDAFVAVGHSAGAYFAQGMAARRPDRVAGLALICPLLPGTRDIPEHRPVVVAADGLGDQEFRDYFVVQTPEMLDRYERFVAPAASLADHVAMQRIGERWELTTSDGPTYGGPVLVVAGRQDATVGHAAATDLLGVYSRATLAVLDGAGHALPHEQPTLLADLVGELLARADAKQEKGVPARVR